MNNSPLSVWIGSEETYQGPAGHQPQSRGVVDDCHSIPATPELGIWIDSEATYQGPADALSQSMAVKNDCA